MGGTGQQLTVICWAGGDPKSANMGAGNERCVEWSGYKAVGELL